MLILYAILLASAGISTLAEASAIKGHSRPHEDVARSVKLGQIVDNVEQQKPSVKSAAAANVAAAPQAPILESTKRIYNDEYIRRLAAVQQSVEPIKQVEQQAPAPVAPVVAAPVPVVAAAPAPVPVVAPVSAPVPVVQAKSFVEQPLEQPIQPAESPVKPVAAEIIRPVESPVVPVKPVESAPVVLVPVADVLTGRNAEIVPAAKQEAEQLKPVAESQNVKESPVEPLHIEVPAPDPALVLSEPIDSTTKLLIDLDEHVQKFLPAEEQQVQPKQPAKEQALVAGVDYSPASPAAPVDPTGKSSGPLVPYSSVDEPIVPPLPSLDGVEKASAGAPVAAAVAAAAPSVAGSSSPSSSSVSSSSSSSSSSGSSVAVSPSATRQGGQNQNQQQVITQLLDQLDSLQNRIQDTINQLVSRRRYVMSALLRPMGTYVRRVRTNLERLQNRVNQLQAAAVSVGGGGGGQRPGGFVDAAAIETIRRRIDDISKRISDIVNRIRFSLTPTSAPLNSNGRK